MVVVVMVVVRGVMVVVVVGMVVVVVEANHGYSSNSDQPNVFMAVAMDLPDFESPIGPLVSCWWWWL